MKRKFILIVATLLAVLLLPAGIVFAHGQSVITVQPLVASAGSKITVKGSEMESGEVFTVSLEGISGSIPLGKATATETAGIGGFEAVFTIPANTSPGSYTVRAATDQGEKSGADLTVTAPTAQASSDSATIQEPSGAQHMLDRSKPLGQVIGVGAIALLSGLVGLWLVLTRK